jgi:hypothetical protein
VPELEDMARAAGHLGKRQSITRSKPFQAAKKALGIRSIRAGFAAAGRWCWHLPERGPMGQRQARPARVGFRRLPPAPRSACSASICFAGKARKGNSGSKRFGCSMERTARPVPWQPAFRLQPNSPLLPRRHSGADSKKYVNSISYMRKGPNCGPHAFLAIPSSASKRTCAPLATPGISRVEKLPGQNHILPR